MKTLRIFIALLLAALIFLPLTAAATSGDSAITMDVFAALAKELEAAGVRHEMVTYSDAPHAFTVFDSDRYREDADRKSWARFTAFLEEKLR